MVDVQNSVNPIAPPPLQGENLPMLYYGLVVVGTAAAVLAMYNLIIIRWCTGHPLAASEQPPSQSSNSVADDMSGSNWGSSFKYKKGSEMSRVDEEDDDNKLQQNECSVCLSGFEDGELVSELARCKHSFHAQCIGMWLYSHFDCPLCRQRVGIRASFPSVLSASSGV